MRKTKNFPFKEEDILFEVRTVNEIEESFLTPYRNEVQFESFGKALEEYLRRTREYYYETHHLVIRSKNPIKESEAGFEVVITNRDKGKVYAGVYVNKEIIENNAMEMLRRIREIVKGV